MKYTQIPANAFENLQLNAGVLVESFVPETGSVSNQIGATSGGVSFTATPTYTDFGEDIDNCPTNTKELKKLTAWEAKMSGTFLTVSASSGKQLVGAGDVSGNKITPRADVKSTDFKDIWWVGDYSNNNDGTDAGFIAIHMMNSLSTGGFSIQSANKGKGSFAFEFTAHYSMEDITTIPFEIYIKEGTTGTV